MSEIRTAKAVDLGSFPGCSFVVDDTPPIAQCQEAQIDESAGAITSGLAIITEAGKFIGIDLTGKKVTVTLPAPEAGTYNALSNTDDVLTTDNTWGTTDAATAYTVHDDAETFLTRNEDSFIRYVAENSGAYTKVNGVMYTDLADPPMDAACSDTFSPV